MDIKHLSTEHSKIKSSLIPYMLENRHITLHKFEFDLDK